MNDVLAPPPPPARPAPNIPPEILPENPPGPARHTFFEKNAGRG